jgi:6-phosphofructokinase 1
VKRIAVLTSGGDAPGMNAAIRAVTRTAIGNGAEVVGIRRGYAGLMAGDFQPLTARDVGGIIEEGGTILESARAPEFSEPAKRAEAVAGLRRAGIEGLIVIGGNGSQTGSLALVRDGFPVNGVASTIDNDLAGSDITIGVDTAVNIALESIDRLRTTASSHRRLFIVEVMGRDQGYLALAAGIAGGAEVIVTPEQDLSVEQCIAYVHQANARGKKHVIVVVAEGVKNRARELYDALCNDSSCTYAPRITILGHVQRGGEPTAFDRLLGTRLGAYATELLLGGTHGCVVGLMGSNPASTPLEEVVGRHKPLPEDMLRLLRSMKH